MQSLARAGVCVRNAVRCLAVVLVSVMVAAGLAACSPPPTFGYVVRSTNGLMVVTCSKSPIVELLLARGSRGIWDFPDGPAIGVVLPPFTDDEYSVRWIEEDGTKGYLVFDSSEVVGDMMASASGIKSKDELFGSGGPLDDCRYKP